MRLIFILIYLVSNFIFSQTNSQTDFRSALTGETTNFGTSFFYNQPSKVILGSAYLFDVTTGNLLQKLTAPDGAEFDRFGRSVSLSGNRALVGSFLDDDNGTNSGSAYLFDEWNNDGEIQTLTGARFLVRNINLNISRNAFEAKINDNDSIFSFTFNNIKQIIINGKSYKNYFFNEDNIRLHSLGLNL